ncbi:hypothetical protein EDB80DRAFT_873267 [Ilyonectria destructans]|nr:hypothetical protein EDB80DRAFT_873267 [Ilyonectria destructans]
MAFVKTSPISYPLPAIQRVSFASEFPSSPFEELAKLPQGFPEFVDKPMAWKGHQFADETEYIYTLNTFEINELECALGTFKVLGLDGDLVSPTNFQLPTLGPKLRILRHDIYNGKGFGVIRGLCPQRYSVEDLTILYLGLQSYIANQIGRQDEKGNMLVHIVADNSTKLSAGHHRHSKQPITFHNEESGDIISWLTRSTAISGGNCIISPAYTVYNILAARRPDIIHTLALDDWPFAMPRFQRRSLLFYHEGNLILNFGRVPLVGNDANPRPQFLPNVNWRQSESLEAIDAIAESVRLGIATKPGDIHFVNNLAIMHRREGFIDGEVPEEKRHLVRTRLRDEQFGWKLPDCLEQQWSVAFNNAGPTVWHLEPMPTGYFPLRTQCN